MSGQAVNHVLSEVIFPSFSGLFSASSGPAPAATTLSAANLTSAPLLSLATFSPASTTAYLMVEVCSASAAPVSSSALDWAVLLGLSLIGLLLLLSVGSGLVLLSLPSVWSLLCRSAARLDFSPAAWRRHELRVLHRLAETHGFAHLRLDDSRLAPPLSSPLHLAPVRNDPGDTAAMFAYESSSAMVGTYVSLATAVTMPAAAVSQRSDILGTAFPAAPSSGLFFAAPAARVSSSGLFGSVSRSAPAPLSLGEQQEKEEIERIIEETELDDDNRDMLGEIADGDADDDEIDEDYDDDGEGVEEEMDENGGDDDNHEEWSDEEVDDDDMWEEDEEREAKNGVNEETEIDTGASSLFARVSRD